MLNLLLYIIFNNIFTELIYIYIYIYRNNFHITFCEINEYEMRTCEKL